MSFTLRRPAARCVLLDREARIFLIRAEDPVDPYKPEWWEIPGGGMGWGEDSGAAALRELASLAQGDGSQGLALLLETGVAELALVLAEELERLSRLLLSQRCLGGLEHAQLVSQRAQPVVDRVLV